jgi:hypothetical protein
VDIIGFKSLIESSTENPSKLKEIIKATEELRFEFLHRKKENKMYKVLSIKDPYKTKVHQISDCIIISKLAHKNGSLHELLADCSFAIHLLIKHKLLCRGCISYGDVYHTDEYIIGPAYVEAYLGEEKEFVPAVNLSKEVYNLAQLYPHYNYYEQGIVTFESNYFDTCILPHTKDKYFIDYFSDGDHIDVEDTKIHYEKLKTLIIKEYQEAVNYKIKAKYLWMIDRFNDSKGVKNKVIEKIDK